jgi:hypothetical protein
MKLTLLLRTQTESEEWNKISHANGIPKKPGVPILISDKMVFKSRAEQREIRLLYNDEGINVARRANNFKCAPNIRAPKYIINLKGEINSVQ